MKKLILPLVSVVLLSGAIILSLQADEESESVAAQKKERTQTVSLDKIRSELKEVKKDLAKKDKYSCCILPSCDFCAISVDMCPCSDNLSKGDPVCHECKGGWMAGYGALQDVKPEEVKAAPAQMSKMMYESRAKKYLKKK